MDQPTERSSPPHATGDAPAELALFALWSACAPHAPCAFTPAFALDGLVISARGSTLHEAAAVLAWAGDPCWLVAGDDDLSAPGAILHVAVTREAPATRATLRDVKSPRPFRFPMHIVSPSLAPDAPMLVFGGHTRLRATPAEAAEAQVRFGLFGPTLLASAGPADSKWAADLLPARARAGCQWAILLGQTVAYDPPWNRNAD